MKKYVFLFLFIFSTLHIGAYNIIIEDINETYGLPKNRVNCVYQDSIGFLWFGMANGLYKFDLNTFKKYSSEENSPMGFPESDVRAIYEFEPGKILVGTYNKGLFVFNTIDERYVKLPINFPKDTSTISINCVFKDSHDLFWVGTNLGLFHLGRDERNNFEIISHYTRDNSSLISSEIVDIKEKLSGQVWFLTMNDLALFDYNTKDLESLSAMNANSSFIFLDSTNILSSCFETGLDIFNMQNNKSRNVNFNWYSGFFQPRYVFKDSQSNIWLSLSNVGILLMKDIDESESATLISNKNNTYDKLNSNVVYKIYESTDGAIWFCTEEGITMVIIKPDIFQSQTIKSKLNTKLTFGVRSLLNSEENFIWTGTIGEGLKQFHIKNSVIKDVPINIDSKTVGKNIQTIIKDVEGDLWMGTEGDGIIRYMRNQGHDVSTNKMINYRRFPTSFPEESVQNDYIMCLLQDRDRNIWIGTWYGLSLIDSNELKKNDHSKVSIKNFIYDPVDKYSLSNDIIMSLLEDRNGDIWVGTQAGLNRLIQSKDGYKFIHDFKNENGEKLTEKKILIVYQDSHGKIWFSTQDGGICLLDTKTSIYKEYNFNSGFHDDIVNSIIEDSLGILWLGTNNGLCRFDPEDFSFTIFKTEDGLISNDFFFGSSCEKDDKLYFGGNKGIVYFNPYNISQNSFKPNLVFTDFKLFNKNIPINTQDSPLKIHPSKLKKIILKHNQNYITISFAALNYKQHDDLQYSCILEGLENNWSRLDKERKMTYTNLMHGQYTFKVKAFSPGHINNSKEISLQITVKPPIWKTTLAYLIYIIFLVSIVVWTYIYFLNEEKKKHTLALERMNAKRVHEMDLMKLQFYTNISHELRTPLTLISAPLDALVNGEVAVEKRRSYFTIMQKNVQRLKRLIDQLLDLRKIEEGYLKIEWKNGDIIDFIKRTYSNFENYAEKRNMSFTFHSSISELSTFFDADKLDKILFNLISNAFKYTPDFGKISLRVDIKDQLEFTGVSSEKGYLEIKITDSGVGIPKESILKIFDPFQQVNKNKPIGSTSTGIGLALSKQLVESLKGYIKVESVIDKGSEFAIYFPILKSDPEKNDEVQNEVEENKKDFKEDSEIVKIDSSDKSNTSVKKPLVLLVDDNTELRMFLNDELETKYRIIEKQNGLDGFKEAINRMPDLIISDVMMDKMDGIKLCSKLKNDQRTSHIPVILLTARHSDEIIQNSYDIGADDYITKPFNVSILKTRINNLIEQRRKLRKHFNLGIDIDNEKAVTNKLDSKFLKELNAVIEKNIDNPEFNPPLLASELAMSKMQLYRKVSALTNQTVYNYIRSIRMQKAAKLLLTTDMQISEVAISVGYTEPSNFTKCFNKTFNQSPSNFVKKNLK